MKTIKNVHYYKLKHSVNLISYTVATVSALRCLRGFCFCENDFVLLARTWTNVYLQEYLKEQGPTYQWEWQLQWYGQVKKRIHSCLYFPWPARVMLLIYFLKNLVKFNLLFQFVSSQASFCQWCRHLNASYVIHRRRTMGMKLPVHLRSVSSFWTH